MKVPESIQSLKRSTRNGVIETLQALINLVGIPDLPAEALLSSLDKRSSTLSDVVGQKLKEVVGLSLNKVLKFLKMKASQSSEETEESDANEEKNLLNSFAISSESFSFLPSTVIEVMAVFELLSDLTLTEEA
jgi:hypothetical protein